jgi:hypothetical protein
MTDDPSKTWALPWRRFAESTAMPSLLASVFKNPAPADKSRGPTAIALVPSLAIVAKTKLARA